MLVGWIDQGDQLTTNTQAIWVLDIYLFSAHTYPCKKAGFLLLRLNLSAKQGLVHDARERASSMYLV